MRSRGIPPALIGSMVTLILAGASAGTAYAKTTMPSPPNPHADQSNLTLKQVTVTGTLIQGVAPVGTAVNTLTTRDIIETGAMNTQNLLATDPTISSAFNRVPFPNTGLSGGTSVEPNIHNLPGSGADTTLLLLNGHDFVGVGGLQTSPDMGIIPPAALKSVQIVANGGDAIYGADAVGGIVNLITRKGMQGVRVSAHYGWANEFDSTDANLSFGNRWSTGSYIFSYSYQENTDLLGANRPYARQNLTPFGGVDNRVNTCSNANVIVNNVSYAMPSLVAGTQNLCDQALATDIFPAMDQNSAYFGMRQQLAPTIKFSLVAYWTQRGVYWKGPQDTATGTITSSNPYFIPVAGATNETVAYSFTPVGGPSAVAVTGTHEWGITPNFKIALPHNWNLDVLFYAGKSSTTATTPLLNSAANSAALAGTTIATALDPYNIAQTVNSITNNILNFQQYVHNDQTMLETKVVAQGAVFNLPAGKAHLAVGTSYEYQSVNGLQVDAPPGVTTGAVTQKASVSDVAAYGELMVPIVSDKNAMTAVRRLTFDVQGRMDHYNRFGTTVNPKIGLDWAPARGLLVRGTWGTSFVAPSLEDINGSIDTRAQVISVSPFGPGPFNTRPTILLAGGGNVKPMTSSTYTVGVSFTPTWYPDTRLRLTYWDTTVRHLISIYPVFSGSYFFNNFPGEYVVNPTLEQAQALIGNESIQGPSLASMYSNPATYPYVIMNATRTNLGTIYIDGIDFKWTFSHRTPVGDILANAQGTYTLSENNQALHSNKLISLFSAGNNVSRLMATASLGDQYHRWLLSFTVDYSSGFPVAYPNQNYARSFHPINGLLAYRFRRYFGLKDVEMTFNVDNIANELPPYANHTYSPGDGIDGTIGSQTLGRFFNLGINARF